jgi:patatin-like phospholipase/acyl hydrolase
MFRILCLDGGGIKGVFTASVLARLEEQTKSTIVEHFDLVVGTSTGGILALGLSLGLTAQQLLTFYQERGPLIFPNTSLVSRSAGLFRQLFLGPKLSQSVLRRELSAVLNDRKLGDAKCRLVVPSYDAVASRIYLFKTYHAPGLVNDLAVLATDVALATSAAPTYFAAANGGYGRFVDGGVWANCPVMVGIVEAAAFLKIPLSEIDILSIGATSSSFSIAKDRNSSALQWNVGLVDLLFEAQTQANLSYAELLLSGRLHRINFLATEGRFSLDDASADAIGDLANLGRREVEKKEHVSAITERFINGEKAVPFMPYEPLQPVFK